MIVSFSGYLYIFINVTLYHLVSVAILVGETRTISVVISPTPKKKSPCKVTVSTPEHNIVDLPLKDSTDGYTTTYTPTETGSHKIEVIYEKKPIEMSPFTVMVESVFTETKQTMPLPKVEVKGLEKRKK